MVDLFRIGPGEPKLIPYLVNIGPVGAIGVANGADTVGTVATVMLPKLCSCYCELCRQ